jgi:small subunit ribosomal protein S10
MKFRIYIKSFKKDLMEKACKKVKSVLTKTDCKPTGVVSLPTKIRKFCVLRSPHIDKDSREHFELRIYKKFIDLTTNSPAILDLLLKIQLPSGVCCSLKVLAN